ncbi:MAG: disulfide bond formation protein B [Thiotrichales bacterium]|nr:disulfide bond formation protein B [Thiotrichales bacterium]
MSAQRLLLAGGFATCVVLMAMALWLQHVEGLEPCPLCVLQRGAVVVLGVIMLAGALHDPGATGRRIYGALITVAGIAGAGVAGRHVWLQSLPPGEAPECGPGLEYMLGAFPLTDVIGMVLRGSGECAEVHWTFLALSIPEWTLIAFIAFALFGLWLLATRAGAATHRRR